MAYEYKYFSGVGKWCKVRQPDQKYDYYSVDLYLDEPSWETFKKSGLTLKIRTDKETKEKFVRFRRDRTQVIGDRVKEYGPPAVFDQDGETEIPEDVLIGNGSQITARVEVFPSRKQPGNMGHRLEGIRVDELVVYEPEDAEPTKLYKFEQ